MGAADGMFIGDLQRRLAEVERQLRVLTSGRRLEDASIGARGLRLIDEGGLTINGGHLRMTDVTGSVGLLYFGPGTDGTRIWAFSHEDGELAFYLAGSPGSKYVALLDREGNRVFSTDRSGVGLGRPYLNIPMYPSTGTSVGTGGPFWPQFTNTSYQEVMHGITSLWQPRIRIGVATNNGGSGTVEWELRIDGDTIGSGTGTTFGTFDVPEWGDTTNPSDQISVQLWCRNTSGSASRVTVDYCYGFES
jgi:hypothetical protein